jgi:hypothetical protein
MSSVKAQKLLLVRLLAYQHYSDPLCGVRAVAVVHQAHTFWALYLVLCSHSHITQLHRRRLVWRW